jgi:hypothetical protein
MPRKCLSAHPKKNKKIITKKCYYIIIIIIIIISYTTQPYPLGLAKGLSKDGRTKK